MKRLKKSFFVRPTLKVAKSLLGKFLVRKIKNEKLIGKIVETEAYIGPQDRASHAYGGKVTKRCKIVYSSGGHIYIYLCYGMYWMLNIVTEKKGKPECVLIRALEPVFERQETSNKRQERKLSSRHLSHVTKVADGPGKLCNWLNLDGSFYGEDLTKSKRIWLEDRGVKIKKSQIISAQRIGIDYAGIWAEKPWRFYIMDNNFISRK